MKIRIDKDLVEFTPEHAAEAAELEALWIKLGNCLGGTKTLQPIGTYIPAQQRTAVFHIEGLNEQEKNELRYAVHFFTFCSSLLYFVKEHFCKHQERKKYSAGLTPRANIFKTINHCRMYFSNKNQADHPQDNLHSIPQ